MQRQPSESSEQISQSNNTPAPSSSSQHGFFHHGSSDIRQVRSASSSRDSHSASPHSVSDVGREPRDAVDADKLDEKLRGLSLDGKSKTSRNRPITAGQRVSDYENALTPPTPRQALGFKVIRRSASSDGPQMTDFPNEILTHILSHLHPDSHAAVALVSKRFYALVTTPHAWRMAFMRYFPGHTCLDTTSTKRTADLWAGSTSDVVRSDIRYFGRLTPLATWRSEYLFRTRLMRSLARGKPGSSSGGIGASGGASKSSKRRSAVLTYNSKLPWLVTNIHAVFSNGKRPPRAIQGAGDLGVATMSDPTSGKIEKWGLEDPFSAAQLEEVVPNLVPYGLGDGPVAVPNVMDVSQPYGVIAGEGFPGGRAHFRGVNESCGRYLGGDTGVVDTYPDVPKIPEMSDAICSLWIAKSPAVPAATQSMCGMLTGSALGVVTAYSLGSDPNGPRYANGDMTARWVLSPGVPIISLKIDDNYSVKRRSSFRVWAVALNALGEVYYLTDSPVTTLNRGNGNDVIRHAWLAGRTAYWHLLESTRRTARPDELDKNVVRGAYTPRSPSNDMILSKEQLAAEAREIEKYLRYKPSHFRKVCEGWDMRRRLEVDFAGDDGAGAGEGIFVIDCGLADQTPARVLRYWRSLASPVVQHQQSGPKRSGSAAIAQIRPRPSLFGSTEMAAAMDCATPEPQSPHPPPPTPMSPQRQSTASLHDWNCTAFALKGGQQAVNITASSLDCSSHSLLTLSEDPLHAAGESTPAPGVVTASTTTPTKTSAGKAEQAVTEIPGRRARLLAIGTDTGVITVWNARDEVGHQAAQPLRVLHTDSPEISCLAVSALYLVHGGSDGLVQAWDPLASTLEPIRTLNARSNGRVPRHMMTMNPTLREGNYSAVGAIYLDPDPTVLRGVVSFGAFLRYWTYSSASHPTGRKRRARHSDIHGRIASRRLGGTVSGYIAAEERELRRENEARAREQAHLRKRFGVGALGDLTEEEALRYAEMVSEEAYLQEEQRRASDSAAEASLDTASSISESSVDTITPEPSVTDVSPPIASVTDNDESEFEQQIQQAIRLSLLEGVNDVGQSPRGNSSGDFHFPIQTKVKTKKAKGSRSTSTSPASTSHTPVNGGRSKLNPEDEDLALAMSLSMQEHEEVGLGVHVEGDFPPLDTEGVGKGKGISRQ
ncbi:F-box and WD domain protein [Metarhizium acridum CQMa 102]|uniref:F-box and WD domain protein n=1 Tax=Metarhizium acridum (strain CQMa 102) TaxID=655827 RepID=E9ED11_METAQ|nr:F-box and WD domain protein [Metarhizium acridum CQMa 102]EFY86167.1 F-box and WD domain protein [Metarhizium acridum CQMa 102]